MVDEIIFKLIVDLGDSKKQIDAFQKKLEKLKKDMQDIFKDAKIDLPDTSILDKLKKKFTDTFQSILDDVGKLMAGGWPAIFSSIAGMATQAFTTMISGLGGLLMSGFTSIFTGLIGIATKAFTTIKDVGVKAFEILYDTVKEGVKVYAQFEDDISVARRTMGLTRQETEALGESMDDLSLTIRGATASDLYKIVGIAGNLGLNFKDGKENVEKFVAAIAKIGIATDLSVEQAAEQIPSILTQFRVANAQMGEETEKFGNVLNALGNQMNITQSQIMKVAASLSGSAASAGMTKEQMLGLSAAIGVIDKKFGTAGGNVAQILTKMITDSASWAQTLGMNAEQLLTTIRENPVKALEMVLARLDELKQNKAVDEFAAIIQELGLRGYRTGEEMKKLVMAKDELAKAMRIVEEEMEAQSSLNKEAEASADRLSILWQTVQNAVSLVYKMIGKPFVDALNKILNDSVIPLTLEFVKWVRKSESVGFALKAIAANLGDIVTKYIIPIATSMLEWLKSSEAIDEILRDKIPAAMLIIQEWSGKVLTAIKGWIEYLLQNSDKIWAGIKQGAKDIWDTLVKIGGFLKEAPGYAKELMPIIQVIAADMSKILSAITGIINLFSGQNETLINTFLGKNELLIGLFQQMTDKVNGVQDAYDAAKQASDDYAGLATTGINNVTTAVDLLKTSINATTGATKELGIEAVEQSVFPDMQIAIAQTAEDIKALDGAIAIVKNGVILLGQNADQTFKNMAASATSAANIIESIANVPIKEMEAATVANAATAAKAGYTSATPGDTSEFRSVYADLNALLDKQKQLYGQTYSNAQVATTQIAKLAEGVYANTPYMGILDDMQKGIGANASEIEKLGYSIEYANQNMNQLGNDAVYHSVYPDMLAANEQMIAGVDQLSESYKTLKQNIISANTVEREATWVEQKWAKQKELANLTAQGWKEYHQAEAAKAQTENKRTQVGEGGKYTQGDLEMVNRQNININFEGYNVIDESSKERFIREIATSIQSLKTNTITV